MRKELTPDARFKARVDLWIFSNGMIWRLFQPLYFVQTAFFGLSLYVIHNRLSGVIELASFAIVLLLQFLLLGIVLNAKNDRDIQGEILVRDFDFDPTEYSSAGRAKKFGLQGKFHNLFWLLRHMSLAGIYIIWMLIDVAVCAYVLDHTGIP